MADSDTDGSPRSRAVPPASPDSDRAGIRAAAYAQTPNKPRPIVHVVDDDDAVRDSLRFLLETENYLVRTYPSGPALLDSDLPPAGCVMTDFQIPGMDGLQLQAALAERLVPLAVIVMSAFAAAK